MSWQQEAGVMTGWCGSGRRSGKSTLGGTIFAPADPVDRVCRRVAGDKMRGLTRLLSGG